MADLLGLSARYIDEGIYEGPGSVNRITTELSEVAEGVGFVESFSNVVALASGDGLVLFDTSLEAFGQGIVKSLRDWSHEPVGLIAYTHGHVDHVGGAQALLDEARERGNVRPRIVAHEDLPRRFERYQLTSGYNTLINRRQFSVSRGPGLAPDASDARPEVGAGPVPARSPVIDARKIPRFGPRQWVQPDTLFRDRLRLRVGDLDLELRHSKGETDDHLWAWIPDRRAICTGDLMIWVFPNAGNPQKVQRYPLEWSVALREMTALGAELLLPAHGLPIAGVERIRTVLGDIATALELLCEQTLAMMNEGARLDAILQAVALPTELLEKPYLRPVYDEPEFVVRNIWRLYGGWYDGNPAHLKPAPEAAFAAELATLVGGVGALVRRARECAEHADLRIACQLVELATQAAPDNRSAHRARADIYRQRRHHELSLMAKGIYGEAARQSAAVADGPGD